MASTYSALKIELIGTGEQAGTWGTTTNVNLGTALEEAIVGRATANFTSDADLTISLTSTNTTQVARNYILNVTSTGSLTATRNLIVPSINKPYIIENNTTGGQSIVVKTAAGTGVTVPNGKRTMVYANTTNVVAAENHISDLTLGTALPVTSGGTGVTTSTGTGSTVLSASPTFTGTVNAADLTTTGNTILGNATTDTLNVGNGGLIKDASGNVGIGVSSVYNTSGYTTLQVGNATNGGLINFSNGATIAGQLYNTANNVTLSTIQPSSTLTFNPYSTTIFQSAGTERMRIDSNGNLGVGVTPSANDNFSPTLQIKNTVLNSGVSGDRATLAYNYNRSGGANTYISNGFASYYSQLNSVHSWHTAPSGTAGGTITFTQAMTLDANGNLGIGTSSPSNLGSGYQALTTNGTNGSGYALNTNATSIGLIFCDTGFMYAGTQGSFPFVFRTNATERMRLDTSGNLNIAGLTASSAVATDASKNLVSVTNTGTGNNVLATSPTLVTPALGTPTSGTLTNCTFPTLNQNTTGTAAGLSTTLAVASGGTGVTTSTGTGSVVLSDSPTLVTPALGTPASGTLTNCTFPTLNQNTTGSAATWTTSRNLAGNSVDGSANVAFSNKFIVQGTTDTGLSGAQFLGSLGTGIVKNTTSTGVLSIAVAGDFPTLNQNTTGTASTASTANALNTSNSYTVAGLTDSGNLTFTGTANRITGDFTNATLASRVAFQTSTANSSSVVGVLPSGTGTVSSFNLFGNSSTTANAPYTVLSQTGGKTRLEAGRIGTGPYGNMELWAGGSKQAECLAADGFNITGVLGVGDSTGGIAAIEIGSNRTANGDVYIDFHSSVGSDYDFRIIRGAGANGSTGITNLGTGSIEIIANTNGVRLTNGATSWAAISDETQKDIIEPITNGVDKVATLRSVIGKYKTEDNTRRSFLIAQDVQKVLPEAVVEIDGVLNLAYTEVIPLLVSAINELSARVKELENK